MIRFSLLIALFALATAPILIGSAETEKKVATDIPAGKVTADKDAAAKSTSKEITIAKRPSTECIASEELVQDLEAREQKVKERETALAEREQELDSEKKAVNDELTKLEATRAEIQGIHGKALAEREEKVNKLIETFESMSPKSAAAVIGGVDEELAVTALSRLTSSKAGKILANLKPEQSSKLSEMMAYGHNPVTGKEKTTRGESNERAPASTK